MHTSQLASQLAITACSFLQEHIFFTVYTYLHLQSLSVHGPEIIQNEKSMFPNVSRGWLLKLLQTPNNGETSHNQNICSKNTSVRNTGSHRRHFNKCMNNQWSCTSIFPTSPAGNVWSELPHVGNSCIRYESNMIPKQRNLPMH